MPIFEGQPPSVIYNSTTGYLTDANGTPLTYESYNYADFATIDTSYKRYIFINDLHSADTSSGATGGSRWLVNPLASTPKEKIILDSGPLWFGTYAAFTSAITLSDHPGLRVRIGNVGNGLPILINKYSSALSAYRLVPENGLCTLFNYDYGTRASPTMAIGTGVTSGTFSLGNPMIPGGLIKVGDSFQIRGGFIRRNSTNNTNTTILICFNTTNANNVDYLFANASGTSALDPYEVNFDYSVEASSATSFKVIGSNFTGEHNATSGHIVDKNTAVNFANDMYISAHCGAKFTDHIVNFSYWSMDWRATA